MYHKTLISLVTLAKLKGVEHLRNRFQVALVITANNQSAILEDIGSSPRFVQTTPATLQLPRRTMRRKLGVSRIRGEAIILLRCVAVAGKTKRLEIAFRQKDRY